MKPRTSIWLLCLVALIGITACDEGDEVEEGSAAHRARQQAMATQVLACRLVRERYESAAKLFFARHRRYPASLEELRKKALATDATGCKAKGTYTMDKFGRVTCSVHGR